MADSSFWLLHVGLMLISAAALIVARFFWGSVLAPTEKSAAA